MLEKDARNFLERTPRTNISIVEEIGPERELMGKVARMKLQYFGHVLSRYQGKCRKFGTDSLGGQCRWFTSPRKTQKTVDGRHRRVECNCYIRLKDMSQDREQWRRKTIEWSSAVANCHRINK